jgi:AraC-like DNA-binding protein/mannose-6-phosphate isomerase-like protein (cupin superfamily)
MNRGLLNELGKISREEQELLHGSKLRKDRYASGQEFRIDNKKLLKKGKMIDIRTHTRFVAFPKHCHDYVEILYMCSGSTTHIINDTAELRLETGDLLFIGKGCWHEVLPAGLEDVGVNFIVLPEFFHTAFSMMEGKSVLSDFVIDNLTGKKGKMPYLYFHVGDVLPIQNLVENLIWSLRSGSSDRQINEITMGLLFLQLLQYTGRAESGENRRNRFALDLLSYIDTNFESATLSEFSGMESQPVYKVSRAVTAEFGIPFKKLLQKKRFQMALSQLTGTRRPVSEIIASVGYENTSYFYRKFQETYHMSPGEYRRRYRNFRK